MATYHNPASAIGACSRTGHQTKDDLYRCAVGKAPNSASQKWFLEARRLAREGASLSGARRRRRKTKARR